MGTSQSKKKVAGSGGRLAGNGECVGTIDKCFMCKAKPTVCYNTTTNIDNQIYDILLDKDSSSNRQYTDDLVVHYFCCDKHRMFG